MIQLVALIVLYNQQKVKCRGEAKKLGGQCQK